MLSFLCKTLGNNKSCWSCPCLCICLCLSFVCLDLKWLGLYCEATIQRSIIPYLLTFSIFLPSAPYKDSALPNQAPLWGWPGCVCNWHLVQGCEMKKVPHTMRQRPHTQTDFRHIVFVWKEELVVFVCQELLVSSHTVWAVWSVLIPARKLFPDITWIDLGFVGIFALFFIVLTG